ncbi:MAG: HAD-IA family hydrolase [Clostridia bacterium]|nr:HAD-IA family hydrolase [Clostridia bacterium]
MHKAVIFDLDGTILDTLKDIADNVNLMLNHFGYPQLEHKEIMQYIGNGARMLVKRSIKVELSEGELDEKLAYYNKIYTSSPSDNTCVFSGLREVLFALKQKGYKLAILTNKPQMTTDKVCEKYLKDFGFDLVIGQRSGVPIKPDPTALLNMLDELDVNVNDAYFVGDGETDVMTAINAKVNGIAVLWGYREKWQLEQAGATVFAEKTSDLLSLII